MSRSNSATYGVFVRFRRSKLPLRRKIATLAEAFTIAEALRAQRLHGRDEVFVVRETDGAVMTPSAAPSTSAKDAAAGARAHASERASHALRAAIDRARGAEARAMAAQARLDKVVCAIGEALGRGDASPALLRSHARVRSVADISARAIASFSHATAVAAAHLQERRGEVSEARRDDARTAPSPGV